MLRTRKKSEATERQTGEVRSWESNRHCPRCAVTMFAVEQFGTSIDACGRCGGVWANNLVSRMIATVGSGVVEGWSQAADARAQFAADCQGGLACPDCGIALARVTPPDTSIELDICAAHGTWFDRGEIAALRAALRKRADRRNEARESLDADLRYIATAANAGPTSGERAARKAVGGIVGLVARAVVKGVVG
jgi:Zn-finger nucleic acid-binding protein